MTSRVESDLKTHQLEYFSTELDFNVLHLFIAFYGICTLCSYVTGSHIKPRIMHLCENDTNTDSSIPTARYKFRSSSRYGQAIHILLMID